MAPAGAPLQGQEGRPSATTSQARDVTQDDQRYSAAARQRPVPPHRRLHRRPPQLRQRRQEPAVAACSRTTGGSPTRSRPATRTRSSPRQQHQLHVPERAGAAGAGRRSGQHRPQAAAEPRTNLAFDVDARRGHLRGRGDLPPRAPLRDPGRQRHVLRLQQRDRDARAAPLHHPGLRRERRPTRATGERSRAGVNFNDFKNTFDTFIFDNPFRITPATDNPVFGRTSLPPDNKAITESVGGTFKIGSKTRLTADLTFGQWRQNEDAFIPWTTNTAIVTPERAARHHLPAAGRQRWTGRSTPLPSNGFVTTRLTARSACTPATVATGATTRPRGTGSRRATSASTPPGTPPRASRVPYGYTNDILDVYGDVRDGARRAGGRAGRSTGMKRTFRETEKTTENVFRVAVDVRGTGSRCAASASSAAATTTATTPPDAEHAVVPAGARRGGPARQPDRAAPLRPGQARPDAPRGARSRSRPARARSRFFASFFAHRASSTTRRRCPARTSSSSPGRRSSARAACRRRSAWSTTSTTPSRWRRASLPSERWNAYAFYSRRTGTSCRPAARADPP